MIFKKQPLIVPMLACSAAPSARTRYAITTLRIAGAAPKLTVHRRYSPVAFAVSSLAPSKTSSGALNTV